MISYLKIWSNKKKKKKDFNTFHFSVLFEMLLSQTCFCCFKLSFLQVLNDWIQKESLQAPTYSGVIHSAEVYLQADTIQTQSTRLPEWYAQRSFLLRLHLRCGTTNCPVLDVTQEIELKLEEHLMGEIRNNLIK